MQIVGVENRANVAQRMSGDGGDLGLGASGERKARDGGAAQIVKRHPNNAGGGARLTPD